MRLIEKEDYRDVAQVKRILEMCSMFPDYKEKLLADITGEMERLGFDLTVEDISFKKGTKENGFVMESSFPGSKGEKYANYIKSKLKYRDEIARMCAPTNNNAFKKWRERQSGRCRMELGAKETAIIHAPFIIELSDGCSVGCEFCGLNAGKLKSVFRYTTENAILFNSVIESAKRIIGDGAGRGTLYYASEPLDNPDYESFNNDYIRVFGHIPQITTAVSTRNIDRLKRLLSKIDGDSEIIYRFSVTSQEMAEKIFENFTPEELLFVELLPQYDEAPGNNFVNAGRNASRNSEEGEIEYGDTISCVSGFRVNMCRKEIILSTPCCASKKYPTGEIILDRVNFEDGNDFSDKLLLLIGKHMKNIISPKDEIKIRDKITLKKNAEGKLVIDSGIDLEYVFPSDEGTKIYEKVFEIMGKDYYTRRELVAKIEEDKEFKGNASELLFFIINKMWAQGIFELKSNLV